MVRAIVWTAVIWLVMVLFSGCTQMQMAPGGANSQWVKTDPTNVAEVPKSKSRPITATTYYTAGLLLEKQGNYKGAVDKFNRALDLDPHHAAAINHLGMCYIGLRQYDLAAETFKQAIQQNPNSACLHNNLGFVYLMEKKYADAEAEFTNAIATNPPFKKAHANLGVALAKQGKIDPAINHFRQACSDTEAMYNVALILHAQHKYDQAEKYYQLALQKDPKFQLAAQGLKQIQKDRDLDKQKVAINENK